MNEDKDVRGLAEGIIDFCNGLEALAVKLRKHVEAFLGEREPERKWSWNPAAIKWEKAEGFKGPFEKSEDFNNREFKAMLKDLAAHGGKLTREGYFYWVYKNGSTVGRKKRGERPKANGSNNT